MPTNKVEYIMKKLLLILCVILVCACNSPEYKGIVTDKKIYITCQTVLLYSPVLSKNVPQITNNKIYMLTVKDSLNDERKYFVDKDTYNDINIGDKYFE